LTPQHSRERRQEPQVQEALRRFAYACVILAVALPTIILIALSPELNLWWVETFQAPELETEFGFTMTHQELLPSDYDIAYIFLVIDSVSPGGRFDRAGFTAGDAIVCLYHGRADFWRELLLARDGYQATFKVLPAEGIAAGCDDARSVTIPGRSLIGVMHSPPNSR